MKHENLDAFSACAVNAAKLGGRHALDNIHRRNEIARDLKHDLKLALDLECQDKIVDHIRCCFPDHSILGEEGNHMQDDQAYCWVVDPLDGTLNFSHGLPIWCCSVALQHKGQAVVGAVYLPVLDECFQATCESPAYCNDKIIKVSTTDRLDQALGISGLPKDMKNNVRSRDLFFQLIDRLRRVRILGAAAANICFTACGRADVFFERGIYIWDLAAAQLIAERAGARTSIVERLENGRLSLLCANKHLFEPMQQLLRKPA